MSVNKDFSVSINQITSINGMNVLALDASSELCSLALIFNNGTQFYYLQSDKPRSHAQTILPMMNELLSKAGLTLKDIDLIALTNGPGSFTGIRIAVSVAQGLSYGTGIPCLPVSSLTAMTYSLFSQSDSKGNDQVSALKNGSNSDKLDSIGYQPGDYVIPSLDARMSEVYWGLYQCCVTDAHSGQMFFEECVGPSISKCSDFLTEASRAIKEITTPCMHSLSIHALGDGWSTLGLEELDKVGIPQATPRSGNRSGNRSGGSLRNAFEDSLSQSWNESIDLPSFEIFIDKAVQPNAYGIANYLSAITRKYTNERHDNTSDLETIKQVEAIKQDLKDAVSLEPLYIRNEVSWQKRKRIRSS